MQNTNTKGDSRLRKCVEEIVRSKKILKYEDFDFQTLLNLKMSASEIQSVIESVWKKESDPYTKQIGKWMQDEEVFDPSPESAGSWFEPKDLLYKDLAFYNYKENSLFIRSDIELWHLNWKTYSSSEKTCRLVFSLSPSIIPAQTRWFMWIRGNRGMVIQEIDVSNTPELKRRKPVTAGISSGTAMQLIDRPRMDVTGDDLKIINYISTIL
jgi:hypothetical protein